MKYLSIVLCLMILLVGCGKKVDNTQNTKENTKVETNKDKEQNEKNEKNNEEAKEEVKTSSKDLGGFKGVKFETNLSDEEVQEEASAINAFLEDNGIEIINPQEVKNWSIEKNGDEVVSNSKDENQETKKIREIKVVYKIGEERTLKSIIVDGKNIK